MNKLLTNDDIIPEIKDKIYQQRYDSHKTIEGVKIINLINNVGEEGDFSEIIKLNDDFEINELPGFKIVQINRTKLFPKSVKAWHLHYGQDEIWYVSPSYNLFVGLWDIRDNSATRNLKMRLILGEGNSQLLFIPHGVAHGSANFSSKPVELLYFVNERFNKTNPDEKRINWNILGENFWLPARD